MSRTVYPLAVADLSTFAKSLRAQLNAIDHAPSHVEMLNAVCRSAGYRNYQAFRSHAAGRVATGAPRDRDVDQTLVDKTVRHFDGAGRLLRWPARDKQAELCLWVLWSRIPSGAVLDEREMGDLLKTWHTFADWALLRRALASTAKVVRSKDGRAYRRVERAPPPELRELLMAIEARDSAGQAA